MRVEVKEPEGLSQIYSRAIYSDDLSCRFDLIRRDNSKIGITPDGYAQDLFPKTPASKSVSRLTAIMLNPSTATEAEDDPTVARVMKRGFRAGYAEVEILNLMPYRATDPEGLKNFSLMIEEYQANLSFIECSMHQSGFCDVDFLCAWGAHPSGQRIGRLIAGYFLDFISDWMDEAKRMPNIYTLGTTKDGHPKHPLYISYKQEMKHWPLSEIHEYAKNR